VRFTSVPILFSLILAVSSIGTPSPSRAQTAATATPGLIASGKRDWPQFRGPRRDGICDEQNLLGAWPENGPRECWSANGLGRGYSSPVIVGERLFITGDLDDQLHILALDLAGRPVWQATNGAAWKDPYPGARASVTFSDGNLYHLNAHGRLACLAAATGKEIWTLNVLEQFHGDNITWGLSENVFVDDRAVYITAGGADALVVACDKRDGKVLWQSAPLRSTDGEQKIENPSYVSPILVRFANRRLLIGCSLRHLFCVDADTGKIEWTRSFPTTYSVIAAMPTLVGKDGVFMTAPHGKGGRMFRLLARREPAGSIDVEEKWTTPLDTLQGGIVHADGKLFGAWYPGRKGWAALDAQTGRLLYEARDLIKGAALYADKRLYVLSEDGTMSLIEPTSMEFALRGRFRFARAENDAWAHPVIHNGRLYLRYHDTLRCYDISSSAL
jgi:outer membrane protein assembly factor BamB